MVRIDVSIPEGASNDFEVAHYTVDDTDNNWQVYLGMAKCSQDNDEPSTTTFTVLLKEGCPMPIMQNTHAEYAEHQWLWNNGEGHVLIGGLGIGMCHQPLIDNPSVTAVTIVENSQDVIDLVWEHCAKDETFTLVHDDFESWTPEEGSTFDVVFGDTWLVDNPMTQSDYLTLINNRYSAYSEKIGFWGGL